MPFQQNQMITSLILQAVRDSKRRITEVLAISGPILQRHGMKDQRREGSDCRLAHPRLAASRVSASPSRRFATCLFPNIIIMLSIEIANKHKLLCNCVPLSLSKGGRASIWQLRNLQGRGGEKGGERRGGKERQEEQGCTDQVDA